MRRKGWVGKLAFVFLFVTLLLSSAFVYAEIRPNWILAYAHDEYGNPIYGSVNHLVTAIKRGADVKVMVLWPDTIDGATTFTGDSFGYAADGSIVFLKYSGNKMEADNFGYPFMIEDKKGISLFKTDGTVEYIHYNESGTNMIDHGTLNFKMPITHTQNFDRPLYLLSHHLAMY